MDSFSARLLLRLAAALCSVLLLGQTALATVTLYNSSADSRPNTECDQGSVRLLWAYTSVGSNNQVAAYYCIAPGMTAADRTVLTAPSVPNGGVTGPSTCIGQVTTLDGTSHQVMGTDIGQGMFCFYLNATPTLITNTDGSQTPTVDSAPPVSSNGKVELQCKTGTPGLEDVCKPGTNPIYALVTLIANWMAAILVPVAVLAIILSAIQYITSQGSPDSLKKAKSRIVNAVVGLVLLGFMVAIINFLLPK